MMLLYRIIIHSYFTLIHLVSPFSSKAKLWVAGRKDWRQHLKREIGQEDWIWVHCSSYGEFEDVATVVEGLRQELNDYKVLLTFFSPSGAEKWKNKNVADVVMYLPKDGPRNARIFLELVDPKFVVFSRSDLWPFFLKELERREIPSALVGLLLNEQSSFFKWPQKTVYRHCFQTFSKIYCQTSTTRELLKLHFGYGDAMVIGNCRVDRIYAGALQEIPDLSEWTNDRKCVVVGSSETKEDELVSRCIRENWFPEVCWIVVPHEFKAKEHHKQYSNQKVVLYSKREKLTAETNVLLVDCVGVLKQLYRFADIAIIGGGFTGKGIHNVIEPAMYGVPTLIGPNDRDYPEAKMLQEKGFCQIFTDYASFLAALTTTINSNINKEALIQLIEERRGATELGLLDIRKNF
ncbi:MAG: glycosyltransferase N-terminal domain-containing protein [Crocinitomicaceae bacterium]